MKKKVVIGLSGGVDSAVSAWLLKEQGYEVIGLFMRNWDEKQADGSCLAEKDFEDVARICDAIGIAYYAVDFCKQYQDRVFQHFLDAYSQGFTPNPDILCNREIKFDVLFQKALDLGAEFLATGHYARVEGGKLLTALDVQKDQTYFLYAVHPSVFQRVLFPLGNFLKPQVRALARKIGLCVSEKKDSMGICFIGEKKFQAFLSRYIPASPGVVVNLEQQSIGVHQGVSYYTLGQRKGFLVNKRKNDAKNTGEPWFVAHKNVKTNELVCVQGKNHPVLFSQRLWAIDANWFQPFSGESQPIICQAKARYRQSPQDCTIYQEGEGVLRVDFLNPQRALTPGQSVVFYKHQDVLGGAIITRVENIF